MSARRFTDKPEVDPTAVWSLPEGHPAMLGNRTLFPSTVIEVTADAPERLLVSGENNRKLGKTVEKGAFKGYALYGLSLEERATCPSDCAVRDACYGNGMQMARRHRIGDPEVFYDRLGFEIIELLDEHPGLLIRLHVLGDFPSVDYVEFWSDVLREHEKVAAYGYTHRQATSWGGDSIGDAIQEVKDAWPGRFRIRWSSEVSRADGARIIDFVPKRPKIDEGLVCPAQTDATACCATCGLCWDRSTEMQTILFIKHGPKSLHTAAEAAMEQSAPAVVASPFGARPIEAITLPPSVKPAAITSFAPVLRSVKPNELLIEPSYQRDLSGKSIKLIRKIVAGWDWAKFKPPVCADTNEGLFVIDGQHTAIAAASHPGIDKIPVMITTAKLVVDRADAFVSHNRDRLAMSAHQIFHAELAAGNSIAKEVARLAEKTGAIIPRSAPLKGRAKPGQILAVGQISQIYSGSGADICERVLRIAVAAELAPLGNTVARGLRILLTAEAFAAYRKMPDSRIANAVKVLTDIEFDSRAEALMTGQGRDRACASLIAAACDDQVKAKAA